MTDQERIVLRCRELGQSFVASGARYDREGRFPVEHFQRLKDAGLLGIMAPSEHGGLGADFLTYCKALEQLSIGDPATGLTFNMHNIVVGSLAELKLGHVGGTVGKVLNDFRNWVFAQVTREKKLFASATSEPGVGAHLSRLRTRYRRVAGGFVLNGVKSFVSMAGHADYYVVAARAESSPPDVPAVSFFVVDCDNPGIRIDDVWDTLGMRATASNTVHLTECFVPEERLFLGSEGMALFKATREPHWLVGGYNGVYLGICTAIFDFMVEYLGGKSSLDGGTAAIHDSRIQHQVGELHVALEAARTVTYAAARLVVERRGSREANMAIHRAKYMVGELGPWLASQAIRLCGGSTIARRLPLERLYRDARCGGLMPATSDECLLYVGRAALGIDVSEPSATYW